MPRCGSTTIANICKKNNIKSFGGQKMGFWGRSDYRVNKTAQQFYKCVSNYVGNKVYDQSFIFTSVRNPYARAVSMYTHSSWSSVKTFKDFCNAIKSEDFPSEEARWHSSSVTDHICKNNILKVDFVIKLENLQRDFDIVCDKIDIPRQKIPHKNSSKCSKHYTEYYDAELREIIAKKYAKDIEYFGYKFEE